MRELSPGKVVAGFVIKERLGKGGMGEVYLVHDQKLMVDRALKVIALGEERADVLKITRERFLREARVLARLRHPNIIPVHEVGELGGFPFIVMTYFPSRDGKKWARQENPEPERIRKVAVQIASALAHAHEHGVLHRDIKPTNMLVGKSDEVMLIDFGLAKSKADPQVTRTGRAMGTYNYLAPEYVKAAKVGPADHTVLTDLWAFGGLLYALTCNKPAFTADSDIKLLELILDARFQSVKDARPSVPDAWAQLIHDLMEPDPSKRIQSARIALQRLEALTLTAPPVSPAIFSALPVEKPIEVLALEVAADGALPTPPKPPPDSQTIAAAAPRAENAIVDESLFDHDSEKPSNATPPTTHIAQPSFQAPPEPPSTARARAKKSLLLPIAAALSVLCVGGALILWADSAAKRRSRTTKASYVDPDELKRKQRAQQELDDLDVERKRRAPAPPPSTELHSSLVPVIVTPPSNDDGDKAETAAPSKQTAKANRRRVAKREPAPALVDDPWTRRYGSRVSFNSSVAPVEATTTATSSTAAPIAGVKIPVRVRDAIASAPSGPVIAIVDAPTKVGDIELPKNAELHGRTVGTSGPRILVEFTFAIVNGRNINLKGSALGSDGRAGVPGAKSLGGPSDIAAGGAGGGAQALVDLAAGATDNTLAQGIIRGAGAPTANKTSRFDNEEQIVVADRGARFFVYVEALS